MSDSESEIVGVIGVTEVTEPVEEQAEESSAEPVEEAVEPLEPRRRFPWRWVGAVVVALAVGTGCAFAVMTPQRTKLPGLKTASDGRYTFAPLTLPTLAPGQAAPTGDANAGQQHVSDMRKLLLSPPEGATPDRSLPGTSGWVSRAATVKLMGGSQADQQFQTDGWRHTAAVAWKTPDGAETRIWLLQFTDSSAAGDVYSALSSFDGEAVTVSSTSLEVNSSTSVSYTRVVRGATATWYGIAQVHDIEFLIEYAAPASNGLAPFEQEADLQSELLE